MTDYDRACHFANGVMWTINAGAWAFFAHRPFMALAWLGVSSVSFFMARRN